MVQLAFSAVATRRQEPECRKWWGAKRKPSYCVHGCKLAVATIDQTCRKVWKLHPNMFESDIWQDPCLTQRLSLSRFAVLTVLFLTMCSTAILLVLLENRPYGIQFTSIVGYTAAVAFYTFSRNRNGNQPFLLSCPVVRGQVTRLIRRHLGFVAALFIAETIALKLRPNLPADWITSGTKDVSPFDILVGVLCLVFAIVQTLTNRSLLNRAHVSAQPRLAL